MQNLIGGEDFAQIMQQRTDNGLVQDVGCQFPITAEQRHQYAQVDRMLQQVVVLLPDPAKAAQRIGISQH